ncbi:MAG TPA: PaaI family thioesterase [Candidatus Thermoplasmatota archaeon]|nr:PaaI family thioesterase [Candidatus Thermoplasmatota archaeon]
MESVQDQHAPHGICFGCGPANKHGLQIKSRWEGDLFVARWRPQPHHQAFPGVLNGGICGALLDCHSNWCAVTTLLKERGLSEAPSCVTSEFSVKLKRPTPVDQELLLSARPVKVDGDVVTVDAELRVGEKVTATCHGVFVAVKPGHPAYHRWS